MRDGLGEAALPRPTGARVGLWGCFDDGRPASALTARVLGRELRRRLPDADLRVFTPLGRATALDGGEPVEALGEWSATRRAELAGALDAVVLVVDGRGAETSPYLSEGFGPEHEATCAVLRLDEPVAVLAARWFPPALLAKRRSFLRLMGWYPDDGGVLAAEADVAGLEDVLAVLGAASEAPMTGDALALAVGALRGSADADVVARVDAALDDVADRITVSADARWERERGASAPPRWWQAMHDLHVRLRALRDAYDARGERLLVERAAMADEIDRLAGELDELRSGRDHQQLEGELAAARAQLDRYERERVQLQTDRARRIDAPGRIDAPE